VTEQESPAVADKPARRESLPKLLQFDVPTTLSLTILAYREHMVLHAIFYIFFYSSQIYTCIYIDIV